MSKWEYGRSKYSITTEAAKSFEGDPVVEWLNGQGKEGWELVSIKETKNSATGLFKRPAKFIEGKKIEPLRKSSESKPLLAEIAVTEFNAAGSGFGRKAAKITVQCPDVDFKKDYTYEFQWTASQAAAGPSAQLNMENVQTFAESELRKDLEKMNIRPTTIQWV